MSGNPPPPPPPAEEPPAKRPKTVMFEPGTGGASTVVATTVTPEALKQLRAALRRIRSHIGSPQKLVKASELMRKLLDDGSLVAEVAEEAFQRMEVTPLVLSTLNSGLSFLPFSLQNNAAACVQVLCEAMAAPERIDDVELRRPIRKLLLAAEAQERLFSKAMRRQLDVWKLWAILRPQLHTDDSFAFSKVANNVRDLVAELPEVDPEEDAAFAAIQSGEWEAERRARCREMDDADVSEVAAAPPDTPAVVASEADPFGLDAFLDAQAQRPEPAAASTIKGLVWSATQCRVMRRQALLDCLTTMTAVCKHAWARSSAFQAMDAAWRRRDSFCCGQQAQVQSLHDFVQKTRATVLKGPSAGQIKQDANAFELARKEWSTKHVSSRGKVGAAGDTKATGWLG